jgi:prolipoprotein diacylglyceryltransferase
VDALVPGAIKQGKRAIWEIPAGLLGARLYFLATSWSEVPDHWWGPLAIWKGGLAHKATLGVRGVIGAVCSHPHVFH